MHDFCDGSGPVSAARHRRGGGWVASTATVAPTVYVGPEAGVTGASDVSGPVRLVGVILVSGDSDISGNVRLQHGVFVTDTVMVGPVSVTAVAGTVEIHGSNLERGVSVRGEGSIEHCALSGDVQVTGRFLLGQVTCELPPGRAVRLQSCDLAGVTVSAGTLRNVRAQVPA